MEQQNKKLNPVIFIIPIIIIALIIGVVVAGKAKEEATKKVIIKATEVVIDDLQDGLTTEQYIAIKNEITNMAYESGMPQTIVNAIYDTVDAQDMDDIYKATLKNMNYQILSVDKVDKNHYTELITISNVNMKDVLMLVAERKKNDYTETGTLGKIVQFFNDANEVLNGDVSASFGEAMIQAEQDIITSKPNDIISNTYRIDFIKENGKWTIDENSLDMQSILMTACGIE